MDQIVARPVDGCLSAAATARVDVQVGGMSCAACVRRVERAAAAVPGLEHVAVNLASERASADVAPGFQAAELAKALQAAGYPALEQVTDLAVDGMTCASTP